MLDYAKAREVAIADTAKGLGAVDPILAMANIGRSLKILQSTHYPYR
jgi:hypothetical protein